MEFLTPFDEDTVATGAPSAPTPTPPPPKPSLFVAVAIVQRCRRGPFSWFQVLLEHSRKHAKWAFPQLPLDERERGEPEPEAAAVAAAAETCVRRAVRRLHGAQSRAVLRRVIGREPDRVLRPSRRTVFVVFCLDSDEVCGERDVSVGVVMPMQDLPSLVWAVESELSDHAAVGPPVVYGIPVCPFSVEAWQALPPGCRFASTSPPLVLYHGTGLSRAPGITKAGLKPGPGSSWAMLGPGVYLARWDKASDFARHTVDNVVRTEPGAVFRVMVCGAADERLVRTLTAEDVCVCGCARAFVDHEGLYGKGFVLTAVPDNAGSATRRAEWCAHIPSVLVLLGCMKMP